MTYFTTNRYRICQTHKLIIYPFQFPEHGNYTLNNLALVNEEKL